MRRFVITMCMAIIGLAGITGISYAHDFAAPTNAQSPLINYEGARWDSVWLGQYPQTEIVASLEQCGAYGRMWNSDYCCEQDEELYAKLEKSTFDSKNATVINGTKYCRMKAPTDPPQRDCDYFWDGTPDWHYFKYEPIKWQVLELKDNEVLLLSAQVLNCMTADQATRWLEGSFVDEVMSKSEKSAIVDGKAFMLDRSDVADGEGAVAKGFQIDGTQAYVCRWATSSTYAKACGVATSILGISVMFPVTNWLLGSKDADGVNEMVAGHITSCNPKSTYGVRPAVRINLEKLEPAYASKTWCLGRIVKLSQEVTGSDSVTVVNGTTARMDTEAYTKLDYDVEDKGIATISPEGVITPHKSGTTSVTVTAEATREFGGASKQVQLVVTPRKMGVPELDYLTLTSYDTIKASWKSVKGAIGYRVKWKTEGASEWNVKKVSSTSTLLKELKPGKKYFVKVSAYEEASGAYCISKYIHTLKKASTPIVKKYSRTKASVKWTAVAGATGYQFYSENMKSNAYSRVFRTSTSLRSTGLYKGVKYRYKVRAYKVSNGKKVYGPWSDYRVYKHE